MSLRRLFLAYPVDLVQIHFGPPARNGEEDGRKLDLGLTREMGKKWLKMGK